LFEYLYSFCIASCFSISYSNTITFLFSISFSYTKISLSIAILFYALVYDDDDDDAGLSSGAGTNLKVGGTCQARSAGKFFVVPLHFFGFASTISRFGKRFRVVSTV